MKASFFDWFQKTGGLQYLNLNKSAVALLGEVGKPNDCVFIGLRYLAYHNLALTCWVKTAGIKKHITFIQPVTL